MERLFYDIGAWMEALGGWGYVLAPLVMALVAIFPVPAEAPAMVNGMLFGPVVGSVITWTGALLGALVSFELARMFGRPLAGRVLSTRALERADRLAGHASWPGLLAIRLFPLIAFTAVNWGAGLVAIDRWRFTWTTALGILPGAVLFTASGYGLSALAERMPYVSGAIALLLLGWVYLRFRQRPEAD